MQEDSLLRWMPERQRRKKERNEDEDSKKQESKRLPWVKKDFTPLPLLEQGPMHRHVQRYEHDASTRTQDSKVCLYIHIYTTVDR